MTKLKEYYDKNNWWQKGIPTNVKEIINSRNSKLPHPYEKDDLGLLIFLKELKDIFLNQNNWENIFQNYFDFNKHDLKEKFEKLEELRNRIAHLKLTKPIDDVESENIDSIF